MLQFFLDDYLTSISGDFDVQIFIADVDRTMDNLGSVGVHIRRSGRISRLRSADTSFDQNWPHIRRLRAHLACVITFKPTETGRQLQGEEGAIHSIGYFESRKLSPIQERLVEANLRRFHRFFEARRHSGWLQDPSAMASRDVIPPKFVCMAATRTEQDTSPMKINAVAAAMNQEEQHGLRPDEEPSTIPATSVTGLDSQWGGLQRKDKPGSTATRITATMASARYPTAQTSQKSDQKLLKCPCCCQAIPASELEDVQWR